MQETDDMLYAERVPTCTVACVAENVRACTICYIWAVHLRLCSRSFH